MQPSGRNGKVMRIMRGMLAAACCSLSAVHGQQAQYSEDEVKAAFLYHFGAYVEWAPPANSREPITIAVLGARGVVEQLQRFLPDRTIEDRPVAARPIGSIDELAEDEILFIGREFNDRLAELIEAVDQRPVLVVTDAEDGLDHGAMVNFQLVDQRLRFEISLPAAQNAGLMLSSRLLSAAIRVETVDCWFGCHDYEPSNHAPAPRELARSSSSLRPSFELGTRRRVG